MKRQRQKIVGVVVYDYPMARIADSAGVDIVSVGDSVGVNLWGRMSESDVTVQEMLLVCTGVRRAVTRALVSCDIPEGADPLSAARLLTTEGGADLVKMETGAEAVRRVVESGVPVWAQLSGQGTGGSEQEVAGVVRQALALEGAGASLLDFRHSGPVAGAAVAQAVSIPVIGGLGGGPWLDGRVRALVNAIGYSAAALDDQADRYANVARIALDAVSSYAQDVRSGRQVRGK